MAPRDRTEGNESSDGLSEPLLSSNAEDCSSRRDVRESEGDSASAMSVDERLEDTNWNVRVILCYTFCVFAGRSIWNQNVLATFAFLLRDGDPKAVGSLTAVMGIAQLLVSFPAGFLADKYRRDFILRIAGGVGCLAVSISLLALYLSSFVWLLISLCIWGVYWGASQTSLMALFADSIPDGQRAHYFTTRSILIKVGQLAGPTVALFMFLFLGNRWTIHQCSAVMILGQLICLPTVLLLFLLNDDCVVQIPEESLEEPLLQSESQDAEDEENGTRDSTNEGTRMSTQREASCDEAYDAERLHSFFPMVDVDRIIPTFVALADVASGLASGMSIRYFPIFLADNLQIGPVMVQVLYVIAPLVQVGLMKLIQLLSKKGGRCMMAVIFKSIGIALMFVMVVSYTQKWPVFVTCSVLVFRTAFMNSPSALTRSVLLDNVKKEERARWSALESLNMFSWSGSAILGGILVDKRGIVFNFCVTACLQFLASMPLVVLSFFRKRPN